VSGPYDRVAWCYDELAAVWSAGAIPRVQQRVGDSFAEGEQVLFVGAGRGRDVLRAVRRGARVTTLDASSAMSQRLAAELAREGLRARQLRGDLLTADLDACFAGRFDAAVASFVLNVFAGDELDRVVARVAAAVRPGGRVLVADFAPACGGPLRRLAAALHYWPVALVAHALGLCALHPLTDYGALLEAAGLRVETQHGDGFSRAGLYRVWVARRPPSAAIAAGRQKGTPTPSAATIA